MAPAGPGTAYLAHDAGAGFGDVPRDRFAPGQRGVDATARQEAVTQPGDLQRDLGLDVRYGEAAELLLFDLRPHELPRR